MSNKITCVICGKEFWYINATHLKKQHNMTVNEYKEKYPHAPIASEYQKSSLRRGSVAKKHRAKLVNAICPYCESDFTHKEKAPRKYCTKKCFNDSRRGIPLSKKVKEKISESKVLRNENERRSWENINIEPVIPTAAEQLINSFKKAFPEDIIELNYPLETGDYADIAIINRKIAISLYPTWFPDPKISQEYLNKYGWFTCDVFSTHPKRAAIIASNNLDIVGSNGSRKTPDFRYVSTFYSMYKDSIMPW